MNVTYIGHSGFAVELENCTLLFDYYIGAMPVFAQDKPLFVFASHVHKDHFNLDILKLRAQHPNVTYIFSYDIRKKWGAAGLARHGMPKEAYGEIVFLKPHEQATIGALTIETLDSTDAGVAFLVSTQGQTLFHAGDLSVWVWDEEPPAENAAMTARFRAEIDRLQGRQIDAAFVVLDPRQQAYFAQGFDYFMRHTNTALAYPMHFWNDYSVFARLREHPCSEPYRERVAGEGAYGK